MMAALGADDSAPEPLGPGLHDQEEEITHLRHVIEHAGHLLPAQGPINVFIHHNTLHAFEHLPFDEGVQKGARLFGCQPYLSEDRYREYLGQGRIQHEDLIAVLIEDLGETADEFLGMMGTRFALRMAMLEHPLRVAPSAELRWFVAETDALAVFRPETLRLSRQHSIESTRRWTMNLLATPAGLAPVEGRHEQGFRSALVELAGRFDGLPENWGEATWEEFTLHLLWRVCREGVHGLKIAAAPHEAPLRHRDLLLAASGADSDQSVDDVLIRFCSAFLDQGLAHWPLPRREAGFFRSFMAIYTQPAGPPDAWLEGLAEELRRIDSAHLTPADSILESLDLLGVAHAEWEEFITGTLLALRGWAGMIRQVELRADRAACPVPPGSLLEYLAVRLILERLALAWLARERLGFSGPLEELRQFTAAHSPKRETAGVDQRAFLVFQLAQVRGWAPLDLHRMSRKEWTSLVGELEAFSAVERRRVFHAAFERRYRVQTLDAIACHAKVPHRPPSPPKFQVVCCLDEREESFRRHLEEIAPEVETFGAAGFFSVPMYYRGAAEAHFVPLCPIVIVPQNWVLEDVIYTLEGEHDRRAKARRALGMASHHLHVGSRSFTWGALLTAALGPLASIPLVARVLFPRVTARIRRSAHRLLQPPALTQLELERHDPQAGPEPGHLGFTLDEMASMAERLLRDIGLTSGFARLVLILGHGSSSLNNPHNSAYNCGACGGGAGGPNARAFAKIANDPRVRERLRLRGIEVPDETVFLGGYHNTCNDELTWLDLNRLPRSHQKEFEEAQWLLELTCERNAHERCRRFMSAPLNLSFAAARRHVEARSEDLSQVRPECGHATNALAIVGRRSRTRGLFMDRRAFLTSYDPTQDDADGTILGRIMSAVVPVCAGINLEYYFSYVDSTGYGCGTKLPHNVTSLLGVMDGAASDLRTGLPWQMVEIHEPVRLQFLIETTPEAMTKVMNRSPAIGAVCRNGWVQLATLSPSSNEIHVLKNGRFELYKPESSALPEALSSTDWYRGQRNHLPYVVIKA